MEGKKSKIIESKALEKVTLEEKKSWWSVAFVWAGNVICVPALMVGGMCVSGMTFGNAALALVIGYAIVVSYMFLLSAQAAQLGYPSTVTFSRALGTRGSGAAISLIIAISYIGWFGYQTMCAAILLA